MHVQLGNCSRIGTHPPYYVVSMSNEQTAKDFAGAPGELVAHTQYEGMTLGRRERQRAQLRVIAEITLDRVVEPVADLAVADRVAYVLAHRSGQTHAVIATTETYLVCSLVEQLSSADCHTITQSPGAPRIISVATATGVCPILTPLTSRAGM